MIRINHAILHVFDFTSCVNVFSQTELDLEDRLAKSYVTKLARKASSNLDNMHGEFSPDSMFATELRSYFAGDRGFVDLSIQIAEYIAGELGRMSKSESTDLLVVDFEEDPSDAPAHDSDAFDGRARRCFGVLLLESRQAYMHVVGCDDYGASCNGVERHHAILPNPSQKISSYALIDGHSMNVAFQDKKREIAGEERWLIPDGLLQCSMEASSKEVVSEFTRVVEEVAEEYGANSTVALSKAKAYVKEAAERDEDIDYAALAEVAFEDEPLRERFVSAAVEEELPETVHVEKEAARRIVGNHKIRTDTGIEITFPSEYAHNSDFIEFSSAPNGLISIELKNIGRVENRR